MRQRPSLTGSVQGTLMTTSRQATNEPVSAAVHFLVFL